MTLSHAIPYYLASNAEIAGLRDTLGTIEIVFYKEKKGVKSS